MPQANEREFLRLAMVWIEARWCIMGRQITDSRNRIIHRCDSDRLLRFHLLGCHDYEQEMRLILQELPK